MYSGTNTGRNICLSYLDLTDEPTTRAELLSYGVTTLMIKRQTDKFSLMTQLSTMRFRGSGVSSHGGVWTEPQPTYKELPSGTGTMSPTVFEYDSI